MALIQIAWRCKSGQGKRLWLSPDWFDKATMNHSQLLYNLCVEPNIITAWFGFGTWECQCTKRMHALTKACVQWVPSCEGCLIYQATHPWNNIRHAWLGTKSLKVKQECCHELFPMSSTWGCAIRAGCNFVLQVQRAVSCTHRDLRSVKKCYGMWLPFDVGKPSHDMSVSH